MRYDILKVSQGSEHWYQVSIFKLADQTNPCIFSGDCQNLKQVYRLIAKYSACQRKYQDGIYQERRMSK